MIEKEMNRWPRAPPRQRPDHRPGMARRHDSVVANPGPMPGHLHGHQAHPPPHTPPRPPIESGSSQKTFTWAGSVGVGEVGRGGAGGRILLCTVLKQYAKVIAWGPEHGGCKFCKALRKCKCGRRPSPNPPPQFCTAPPSTPMLVFL